MIDLPCKLLEGYRHFIEDRFPQKSEQYHQLAKLGQKPATMVIACCDSRAAPETIFSADPGEIFVMRNVANLVPPFQPDGEYHATSAALEFAVRSLEVGHIVILGHGRCGGISTALRDPGAPLLSNDFIGQWMSLLAPAAASITANDLMTESERHTALERISIRYSITNLRSFPWIKARETEGRLSLHGAWFDIASGELWVMEQKSGDFYRVVHASQ